MTLGCVYSPAPARVPPPANRHSRAGLGKRRGSRGTPFSRGLPQGKSRPPLTAVTCLGSSASPLIGAAAPAPHSLSMFRPPSVPARAARPGRSLRQGPGGTRPLSAPTAGRGCVRPRAANSREISREVPGGEGGLWPIGERGRGWRAGRGRGMRRQAPVPRWRALAFGLVLI